MEVSDGWIYQSIKSPNYSSRRDADVSGVVVHYTAGGSARGSIKWLCDPKARASAHFVIDRVGVITQLVSLKMNAWHAGVSEMLINGEMCSDANRYTIGVELANHGLVQEIDGDFYYEIGRMVKKYHRAPPVRARLTYDNSLVVDGYWEPYPDAQIDAMQGLLMQLKSVGYGSAAENLIGHEEIGMPFGRKKDPGPLFPWERFRRATPTRTMASLT